MRVGLVIVLLLVVVAISVWYKQRAASRTEADSAMGPSSAEKTREPALRPPGNPRDAPRERPGRERTDRSRDGPPLPK